MVVAIDLLAPPVRGGCTWSLDIWVLRPLALCFLGRDKDTVEPSIDGGLSIELPAEVRLGVFKFLVLIAALELFDTVIDVYGSGGPSIEGGLSIDLIAMDIWGSSIEGGLSIDLPARGTVLGFSRFRELVDNFVM